MSISFEQLQEMNSKARTNSRSSSSSNTNFAAGGEAALAELIKQLLSGGTDEQIAQKGERNTEISAVRNQRADYSKGAAFADAQGAVNQQQRQALEKLIPQITRSAEGAGTSQSSLRALLIQDAANKAAESSAALGLKASVDYGQISTSLSSVLEALTRQDNPQTKALLEAINLSKGQNSESVGSSEGGGGVNRGSPNSYQMGPIRASLLADSNFDRTERTGTYSVGPREEDWNEFQKPIVENMNADRRLMGNRANAWESFTF